jgi:hypothetical protein
MRIGIPFALLATALGCSVFAMPAQAQRARVFVASYGSDSNPCTFGSPCRTFQAAVTAVADGGEVTAIDSAGFEPVTINKSVTITSPAGVEAGVAAATGGAAITVAAGMNDVVSLHGLTLEGGGTGGSYGVYLTAAGKLDIVDCIVRDYAVGGIEILASNDTEVSITDSYISHNQAGVYLQTSPSANNIIAALDHVTLTDNAYGVQFYAQALIVATISNSTIDHSSTAGISAGGSSAGPTVNLTNITMHDNFYGMLINSDTTMTLSHVNDYYSGGMWFNGTSISVSSDDTSHVVLAGPNAPGSLGAFPFK